MMFHLCGGIVVNPYDRRVKLRNKPTEKSIFDQNYIKNIFDRKVISHWEHHTHVINFDKGM